MLNKLLKPIPVEGIVRTTFEGNGKAAFLWKSNRRDKNTTAGFYAIGPGSITSENSLVNSVNPMFEGMPGVRSVFNFGRPTIEQLIDMMIRLYDNFIDRPPLLSLGLIEHLPQRLIEEFRMKLDRREWKLGQPGIERRAYTKEA